MRLLPLLTIWVPIICLVLVFESIDCRALTNRSAKAVRSESKRLKKQSKKIRKSYAKKLEQLYMSMCTDCFSRLQQAISKCEAVYDRLQLSEDKMNKCKKAAQNGKSRSSKKKKLRNESSARNQTDDASTRTWKQLYEDEQKMLSCLLKDAVSGKKYETLSKDELRKEKNTLMQEILKEKTDCIQKAIAQ